jgi:hypothetical protein
LFACLVVYVTAFEAAGLLLKSWQFDAALARRASAASRA